MVSQKIGAWVAKLGWVWVDGQVAQVTRRPGTSVVFLTLRDPAADISLTVTAHRDVLDAGAPNLAEGARIVAHAKPDFFAGRGTLLAAGRRDPPGRARRAAGPAGAAQEAARRRGAVRPGPQAPAAVPARPDRADHRPGQRGRAGRADQRPAPLAGGGVPGGQRGGAGPGRGAADHRRARRARPRPGGRRDHHGPRRRQRRGPAALLRRGAVPGRLRLPDAGDLRDRPRDRHAAGRLRRRRTGVHADRRGQARRARPGRGGAPDRPGPGPAGPGGRATWSTASSSASTRCAAGRCWPGRRRCSTRGPTQVAALRDRAGRTLRPPARPRPAPTCTTRWPGCAALSPAATLERGYAIVQRADEARCCATRPRRRAATRCGCGWPAASWPARVTVTMTDSQTSCQLRGGPGRAGPGGRAAGVRRRHAGGVAGAVGARREAGRRSASAGSTAPGPGSTPPAQAPDAVVQQVKKSTFYRRRAVNREREERSAMRGSAASVRSEHTSPAIASKRW